MEELEITKPTRSRFRVLIWTFGVVLAGLIVLVLVNVVLVINQVNRDVQPPKLSIALPDIGSQLGVNGATTSTTSTRLVLLPGDRGTTISTERDQGEFIPPNDVPEKCRTAVENINKAYRGTLESYAAYLKESPNLSFDQGMEKLKAISDSWEGALQGFFAAMIKYPCPTNYQDKSNAMKKLFAQLKMDNAIRHEQWFYAVTCCRDVGLGWPDAVYLLQKMGPRGKVIIAEQTTKRYWKAIAGSVMSIGPNFHWPKVDYSI